jgi:hypothetical protein
MTAAGFSRHAVAAVLVGVLAGVASGGLSRGVAAASDVLLAGKIVSSTGERLAGVPVRARRANSTIAVTVYTNGDGDYIFPEWSDLTPGSHSISIELCKTSIPGFKSGRGLQFLEKLGVLPTPSTPLLLRLELDQR